MATPPFPPRASTPPNDRRPTSCSGGYSARQRSIASAQRGAKAQPGGRLVSDGTMPGISISRVSVLEPRRGHRRHRGHQAAGVGMPGIVEQRLDAGFLDLLAGIHHDDALRGLRDHAEIVGDQDQPGAEFLLQIDDQRQDLGLDRDVERGGRLVRDQQRRPAGQRHRDHGALAHAAGELVRILLRPAFGLGNPDQAQHFDRLAPRLPCASSSDAGGPLSVIWSPIRITGLSEVIGSWKIIEMRLPRIARISASSRPSRSVPSSVNGAADDPARRIRHQPHDRQRGHALAAAGLADDGQRLAAANAERDVVDRLEQPRIGEEHRLQVLHVENRLFRLKSRSSAALPRVEDVAQRVAEQIGAEHREADRDAGEDHQPRRGADIFRRRFRQHAAP